MNLKRIWLWIIISVVSFTSCQNDEDILFPLTESEYEYIEIQGNIDDVTVLMNSENIRKYKAAVQRVLKSAKQNGTDLHFNAQCGADLNISERLYTRLTQNYLKLIKSGRYILIKEYGEYGIAPIAEIEKGITRLKSGHVEGGESAEEEGNGNEPLSLDTDGDVVNNIINGFRNYKHRTTNHMTDLWDMDSYDWGYAGDSRIIKGYSMGGYQGRIFMNSGCSGNWVDQNCPGNGIMTARSYFDEYANKGFFTMYGYDQRPLVSITVNSNNGYNYMRNQLGGFWK